MIYKSILVVAFLLAGNCAVAYIRHGYEMGKVVPPTRELDSIPLQLSAWSGKELPSDPRIREILRAQAGIDRLYHNPDGQEVKVHAVWTDDYLRLHFPQQCYRESGWELVGTEDVKVAGTDNTEFSAKILKFMQGDRRIQVLYWFQLGDHVFLDRLQHRLLRRQVCWGQKEWPPLMKFMIETSDSGLDRSEAALTEMASELHAELASSAANSGA